MYLYNTGLINIFIAIYIYPQTIYMYINGAGKSKQYWKDILTRNLSKVSPVYIVRLLNPSNEMVIVLYKESDSYLSATELKC